eukprot:scaffold3084_cov144-Cylindrotheca_fusiformis.AAC.52
MNFDDGGKSGLMLVIFIVLLQESHPNLEFSPEGDGRCWHNFAKSLSSAILRINDVGSAR